MKDNTLREVKRRLYSYPKLDGYITDYERELEGIRHKISAHRDVGASSMSLTGVRGSDLSDPTVNKMLKIDALQQVYAERAEYIAQKVRKYYEEKQCIESAIDKLSQTHREIIEERYFKQKTWDEVGELFISARYCEKQGGIAIRKVADIINKKGL